MARIVFQKPAEDKGYTPLPEGLYDWEIKGTTQTTSQAGNPQLELQCECAGPQNYAGRNTKMWYSLLPQSGWRVKKLLDACGVDYQEEDGPDGPMLSFDDEDLIGCIFAVKGALDESPTGTPRNKWTNESPSKLAPQAPQQAAAAPAAAPAQGAPAAASVPVAVQPSAGASAAAAPFQPRSSRRA